MNDDDLLLLSLGLKFAPTPNWNKSVVMSEWLSLFQHIRRCEWNNIFDNDHDNQSQNEKRIKFPAKLKLPKTSRPSPESLCEETKTYTELITNKLRNVGNIVRQAFAYRNNLNVDMQKSFAKIKDLVRQRLIVICRADKDGKIVLLDQGGPT